MKIDGYDALDSACKNRSGEYGPSLLLARAARDEFYRTHEKAALEAAG